MIFYIIYFCSLYYFIRLYVRIRIELLGVVYIILRMFAC